MFIFLKSTRAPQALRKNRVRMTEHLGTTVVGLLSGTLLSSTSPHLQVLTYTILSNLNLPLPVRKEKVACSMEAVPTGARCQETLVPVSWPITPVQQSPRRHRDTILQHVRNKKP